jgi:methylglyoxal reductase
MQYRELGRSGIQASVVGLGTWAIGGWMWGGTEEGEAIKAIQAGVDAGCNLVDTAPAYGFGCSEEIVGRAIRGRRDRVVLASKCGLVWDGTDGQHFFDSGAGNIGEGEIKYRVYRYLGRASVRREVEASLRRMRVDCIDLMQTHWQDPTTPISETMAELLKLQTEGKLRAIGACNLTAAQLETYSAAGLLAVDQELYSMLDRKKEQDLLPVCREKHIAFLAYSPLAQGLLTGRVGPEREFPVGDQRRNNPRFSVENRRRVVKMMQAFQPVADKHRVTLSQLTIAWTVHQSGVTHALVGARSPRQALENANAGALVLDAADLQLMADVLSATAKESAG